MRRDPRPAVGDAKPDERVESLGAHPQRAAARRELDGVDQEVGEDLQNTLTIGGDLRQVVGPAALADKASNAHGRLVELDGLVQ